MESAVNICLSLACKEFVNANDLIICSECPGWLCYSIKQHFQLLSKYYSKIKSPMEICYEMLSRSITQPNYKIVFVMPCYDKKIEVALLKLEKSQVITTVDLESILNKYSKNRPVQETQEECILNGISNGYIEYIVSYYTQIGAKITKQSRPTSYWDGYQINYNGSTRNLIYTSGFRDIQRMIRQVKQGKLTADYIEVLACPKGCMSGIGQKISGYDANSKWPQYYGELKAEQSIKEDPAFYWDPMKFEQISKGKDLSW